MGIFKAGAAALGGTLADQWLEAFSCDAIDAQTLALRGHKMQSERSANTKGDENVISAGSVILVPDGAAAVVTEMGQVIACCETPGEHKFTGEKAHGVFGGGGLSGLVKDAGRRFAYGGDAAIVQRVYFLNTKEIPGNAFQADAVPVRLYDANTTLDMDACVSAAGMYSFRIADPAAFYRNVCGNVGERYACGTLTPQLHAELLTAFAPAIADVCAAGVRPSELAAHTETICSAVQKRIRETWMPLRGIELVSMALDSLTVLPQDQAAVQQMQRAKVLTDPAMAAATLTGALAEAMPAAAKNPAGALTGAAALFAVSEGQPRLWVCKCGAYNTGRFCENCGSARA